MGLAKRLFSKKALAGGKPAAGAARLGYEVPESFIQRQLDATPPMGPYQPSSLVDFLAGRAVEIEAIWGEPLRRAQAAGAAMPRLAALYARLQAAAAKPGVT